MFQSNDCQRGFCLCQDRCLNLTRFFSNNLNRHSLPLHVFCFYSCRWLRDRYVEWIVVRWKNESIGYFAWPSIKTVHSNWDAMPVQNAKHKSTLDILQLHRCVTKLQLCSFQMKFFFFCKALQNSDFNVKLVMSCWIKNICGQILLGIITVIFTYLFIKKNYVQRLENFRNNYNENLCFLHLGLNKKVSLWFYLLSQYLHQMGLR